MEAGRCALRIPQVRDAGGLAQDGSGGGAGNPLDSGYTEGQADRMY